MSVLIIYLTFTPVFNVLSFFLSEGREVFPYYRG